MDISKALTMAKQFKNHFRVFEELDEFMKEAVALKGFMDESESRKAALEEEISNLQEEKAKMSEAIEAMKPIVKETEKAQETLNKLKAGISEIKAKLG